MDPITGFGLILALIPFYQRERDKQTQASKEEFFTWMIGHKFEDLKDCIINNAALSLEIEQLLSMNQQELLNRFDEVDKNLFRIMNSMQEFRGLIKIISPASQLTEQEESILRQFVESEEYELIDCKSRASYVSWCAGAKTEIKVKNPRVMNANLENLSRLGFLSKNITASGNLKYGLTEQAEKYVENLKQSDLSDQAKNILKEYLMSGRNYLYLFLGGEGMFTIQAENTPIELSSPRFAKDDLKQLEERGFIAFDSDTDSMSKRYTLTRDGEEYAKQYLQ